MSTALKPRDLSETGIGMLGPMPWSTHLSLFYATRTDLVDTLVPFFKAGLDRDERCAWLWSDQKIRRALNASLRQSVPAFDRHLSSGRFQFVDGRPWLRPDHFDAQGLIRMWAELSEQAVAGKDAGFRGAGDHTWLGHRDWREFSEFEGALHAFVVNRHILFLCTYPLSRLRAEDILDSARVHHLAIARRRGRWDILESQTLKATKEQIQHRNEVLEQAVAERTKQFARSEAYLAEGQRLTHSGSFAIDMATGQYTYASAENLRIFGYDPDGPLPPREDVMARIHPDDRARVIQFRATLAEAKRDVDLEYRIVLPGRRIRHIYAIAHPVVDATGRVVEIVGSSVDMTDRKRAAAKLARMKRVARERAIKARYVAAFEERTRLAREIHDSLLQGVTGIMLQLRASLPSLHGAPAAATESIRRVVELAESTIRDARRAVWDMRALPLVTKGLPKAIEEAVQRAAGTIALDFAIKGESRPLRPDVEDTVFRVAQEAVVNAVKHADAKRISVRLTYAPRSVRLTVTDDGRGFLVKRPFGAHAGRWGLLGMRERAERIGASLAIRSAPNRGTTVTLRVLRPS